MTATFSLSRRTLVAALTAVPAAISIAVSSAAQDVGIRLFKIVSPKDETIVGLKAEELRALGQGPELEVLAQKIAAAGQMTLWQFATRKAANGDLELAPLKRVAIFSTNIVRIEPHKSAVKVVPPTD
jgi:hypothetical protein